MNRFGICGSLMLGLHLQPYLFYDEKLPYDLAQGPNDQTNRSVWVFILKYTAVDGRMARSPTFRFVDGVARPGPTSSALSHQDRNANPHTGLVKQAYSAWVTPDPRVQPQKWHLTAYFAYADLPNLPTIDRDAVLRKIIVPANIYRSGKARSRAEEDSRYPSGDPVLRSSHPDRMLPTLPSLQSTLGPPNPSMAQPRPHGARLAEDQRVIQMLNSRPII